MFPSTVAAAAVGFAFFFFSVSLINLINNYKIDPRKVGGGCELILRFFFL